MSSPEFILSGVEGQRKNCISARPPNRKKKIMVRCLCFGSDIRANLPALKLRQAGGARQAEIPRPPSGFDTQISLYRNKFLLLYFYSANRKVFLCSYFIFSFIAKYIGNV